jgi:hypothetical protein
MSCHFFRPRPGFRSRGTQTPVDVACQTGDEESRVKVELEVVERGGEVEGVEEGFGVSISVQTDESYPVNYLQWKYAGRRDEGTMTDP